MEETTETMPKEAPEGSSGIGSFISIGIIILLITIAGVYFLILK